MRYSLSLIFGGLALPTLCMAFLATSLPIQSQVIGHAAFILGGAIVLLFTVILALKRRRRLDEDPLAGRVAGILVWAGGFTVALNSVAALSLAAAAMAAEPAILSNEGLAAALRVWAFALSGYLAMIAALSPWLVTQRQWKI